TPAVPLVQLQGPTAPPRVVTLTDALERARQNDATFQTVSADAEVASGDRAQAAAARLPAFSHSTQYLGTQGNRTTPNGRFVTNDGVHVYRSWMVVHQEFSPTSLGGTAFHRAQAAELVANAKLEIAQRGLVVTVTRAYYTLISAQRRYASTQQATDQ